MARPLRLEFSGAIYHITSRGNQQQDIYQEDSDRLAWLDLFGDICTQFNWRCYAWCQMTNHYHVVVETVDANLSRGMRQLNGIYTQYFNRKHSRVGHLYQGRYKSILVERESYLLEVVRYVVLNPVRAEMVGKPGDWPWSSYRATLREIDCPCWFSRDEVVKLFSSQHREGVSRFQKFVAQGAGAPCVWRGLRKQVVLGSEDYLHSLQCRDDLGDIDSEVPRQQRRILAKSLNEFVSGSDDRNGMMVEAYATGVYTMKEIAHAFGVDYSTARRVIKAKGD